jgi:hypothetical protein
VFGSKDSNSIQNLPPPCLRIPVLAIVTLFIGSGMKNFHNILSPAADPQLAAQREEAKRKV